MNEWSAAIKKAQAHNVADTVRRIRYGTYVVPSTTTWGLLYTVTGTDLLGRDMRCTCLCGQNSRRRCVHQAAVRLARAKADALRQVRKLRERQALAA